MPRDRIAAHPPVHTRVKTALAAALPPLVFALSLSACHSSTMNKPDIKQNPTPKQGYEITLVIEDAPGQFELVEASARYVTDRHCVPEQPISGVQSPVETDIPITFQATGPNTYKGTVYQDLLKDEDYYGLGVCHWLINGLNLVHRGGDVLFSSYIGGGDSYAPDGEITRSEPGMTYYLKKDYGNASMRNEYASSLATNDVASRPGKDYFSFKLTSKANFK